MRWTRLAAAVALSLAAAVAARAEEPPKEFESSNPDLPVAFRPPEGWKLKEERGKIDAYRQVRLTGPRNAADSYTPYIIVRAIPLESAQDGAVETATYVSRWMASLPAGATMSPREGRTVAGATAEEFVAVFPVPTLNHVSRHPGPTPVKTRLLILAKPPFLYELIFSSDERDYNKYAHLFDALLDSLRLMP